MSSRTLFVVSHRSGRQFWSLAHFDDDYEKYAVLEYLAYRIYGASASPAIRVRPAEVRFLDTGRGRTALKGFAFLVEDIHDSARHSSFTWLDIERQLLKKCRQ